MPIPKPRKEEKEEAFIARCMKAMKGEFENPKQRLAVCFDAWRKK